MLSTKSHLRAVSKVNNYFTSEISLSNGIALSGIIIAILEKEHKYIITLDDGSGETIDVLPDKNRSAPANCPPLDLQHYKEGDIVMVKGTVKTTGFNGTRQLILRRIVKLDNMKAEMWFLHEVSKWKILARKSIETNERIDPVEQVERIIGRIWARKRIKLLRLHSNNVNNG